MESDVLHKALVGLSVFVLLFAAASDARRYKIPNWTSLTLLLLFPLFVLSSPAPLPWIRHIAVFAIVFCFGYALYTQKLAGAGDVKLLAACSLWAGPEHWDTLLLVTALSGGLLSLVYLGLALRRRWSSTSKEPKTLKKVPVPYGVAIALGGISSLVVLFHSGLPKV